MPIYYLAPAYMLEYTVLLIFIYFFFLIIQLALFNLVILGIICVFITKIFQCLEAFKEKFKFNYQTKDFLRYIDEQNQTVYYDLGIEIQSDREGNWLEFLLRDDEQMFEQEIAKRRQAIFDKSDQYAIQEMKVILQKYTQEKDKDEE